MNLLKFELQKEMEKMQDVLAACKKIIYKAPAGSL